MLDVYNNGYLNNGKLKTKKRYSFLVDDLQSDETHLVNIEKGSKFSTRQDFSDITLNVGLVVINLPFY